jgi:SAM-dependent methyltransferase
MTTPFTVHSKCRLCDSGNIEEVLDLGYSPLANAYLTAAQLADVRSGKLEEIFTPLRCFLCMDCGSVQLEHSVDPKVLFTDYIYASSTSPVFVKHFEDFAAHVHEMGLVKPNDLVVDIGSNDGILLKPFIALGGINAIGVEPSKTLAAIARSRALATIDGFFDLNMAKAIVNQAGKAQVVTACNVFAHLSDLRGFMEAVLEMLDDDGVFIFEVSYLGDVIKDMLFDTIYVEHQFYHSLASLDRFFDRLGLRMFRAEHIDTHGGSIRCFVDRGGRRPTDDNYIGCQEHRLMAPATYRQFTDRLQVYKHRLHSMIKVRRGLAAYGCPAKFTTYCHFMDLPFFHFVVDDSPLKVGKFTPGFHMPIVSKASVIDECADAIGRMMLVPAWNFFDSIYAANQSLAHYWLRPLPKLEVWEGKNV